MLREGSRSGGTDPPAMRQAGDTKLARQGPHRKRIAPSVVVVRRALARVDGHVDEVASSHEVELLERQGDLAARSEVGQRDVGQPRVAAIDAEAVGAQDGE